MFLELTMMSDKKKFCVNLEQLKNFGELSKDNLTNGVGCWIDTGGSYENAIVLEDYSYVKQQVMLYFMDKRLLDVSTQSIEHGARHYVLSD